MFSTPPARDPLCDDLLPPGWYRLMANGMDWYMLIANGRERYSLVTIGNGWVGYRLVRVGQV